VGKTSTSASYSKCERGWRAPQLAMRRVGPWVSPRRPLMAGRGRSTGAGGDSGLEAKGRRPHYRRRARLLATGGPTVVPRGCARSDERRTDRQSIAWCATGERGRSTWRAGTSRAASRCAASWEGARPRSARDPDAEDGRGLARTGALWPARCHRAGRFQHDSFDLGYFDQVFLPKLELQFIEG
jgi:hypothetical protein